MPRTRGQEEKLMEQGLAPTPPQQLPTPRRTTKLKMQTSRTRDKVTARPAASQPPPISRVTRARTVSALQTDRPTQPTRPALKRGRNNKTPKATPNTNEEAKGVTQPVLQVPQESTEEDSSQAHLASFRENSSPTPMARSSPSHSSPSPTSHSFADTIKTPGAPSLEGIEVIANVTPTSNTALVPVDDLAHLEPGFIRDSQSPQPSADAPELIAHEDRLEEIIRDSIPEYLEMLLGHPEIMSDAVLGNMLTVENISVSLKSTTRKRTARVANRAAEKAPENTQDASEVESPASRDREPHGIKRNAPDTIEDDADKRSPKRVRVSLEQTKRVPLLFDQEGTLRLRAYKNLPKNDGAPSSEGNRPSSRDQNHPSTAPVTPRSRGWALSGFLPSARTFAKFLPNFSHPNPTIAHASPSTEQNLRDPITTQTSDAANISQSHDSRNIPQHIQMDDRSSQSEPRSADDEAGRDRNKQRQPTATARTSRRHRHTKSKHGRKTKGEKEEIQMRDEMIASLRAQLAVQNETQAQKDSQAKKAAQAQLDVQAQIDAEAKKESQQSSGKALTRGRKRKAESPDVIPNPPGGGYGMVLDYFIQSSSDDDDEDDEDVDMGAEEAQETPICPSSKRIRSSGGPSPSILRNPSRATPYSGTVRSLPLAAEADSLDDEFIANSIEPETQDHSFTATDTAPNGPTMIFRVPSPSDSDSDEDGSSYIEPCQSPPTVNQIRIPGLTYDESPTQPASFNTIQNAASHVDSTPKRFSPPKAKMSEPRGSTITPGAPFVLNEALDKARQTALKHKPQQPSRLREFSRLSTSTIGTEVENDEAIDKTVEGTPHNPSLLARKTYSYNQDKLERPEMRDPYAGRMMRPSPHDPMLLEPVPVAREPSPPIHDTPNANGEYSSDNSIGEPDLPEEFPSFVSYGHYETCLSPQVKEHLTSQWNDKDVMMAETTIAPQFSNEARTIFTGHFSQYEKQVEDSIVPSQSGPLLRNMDIFVESVWDAAGTGTAVSHFENDFETWLSNPVS